MFGLIPLEILLLVSFAEGATALSMTGNFATDFIIALGIAAACTVVVLTLVCVAAQCGPRMCGMVDKKERWLEPGSEEGVYYQEEGGNAPLVSGGNHEKMYS